MHRSSVRPVLFVAFSLALAASLAGGCSGTDGTGGPIVERTDPAPSASASGTPAATTAATAGNASPPETVEGCIAKCETAHPAGTAKGKKIDECWVASCAVCQNIISDGRLYPPSRGQCRTDVRTPSEACSQCTAAKCCAAWDGCFGDAQCIALNACANACYAR